MVIVYIFIYIQKEQKKKSCVRLWLCVLYTELRYIFDFEVKRPVRTFSDCIHYKVKLVTITSHHVHLFITYNLVHCFQT